MSPDVVVDVGDTRIKSGRCQDGQVVQTAGLAPDTRSAGRSSGSVAAPRRQPLGADRRASGPPRRPGRVGASPARRNGARDDPGPRAAAARLEREIPDYVGIDRLLDAVAVNTCRQPGTPAVIIDAGSAVTVDWVNEQGASAVADLPGLRLMIKTLNDYTALLPLIPLPHAEPPVPGVSTPAAMEAGVFWAVAGGVQGLIETHSAASAVAPEIHLTGGAALLATVLPGARYWPNMTLRRSAAQLADHGATWVAVLTPPGRAALASLALHGPQTWQTVRSLFQPRSGKPLPENAPQPGRFWLGRLGHEPADEVVLAVRSPLDVEIHCHGGREVVR